MYTHRIAYTLASVIAMAVVLIGVSVHGARSRIIVRERGEFVVDSPENAYGVWKEKGVRGRTLVLFDRYPHIRGRAGYDGPPQLSSSNFVEFSIFENIIRRIYFIVPDADWRDFLRQERMRPLRAVPGLERGLFLYNLVGVPIIATTPSSLPRIEEPVLVYINQRFFDDRQARDLLGQKQIVSDIIISIRGKGI